MRVSILNDVTKTRKIFDFNPTCEIAIANQSPYYNAPELLANFEEELAPLMVFFANSCDHVLKEMDVHENFRKTLDLFGLAEVKLISKKKSLALSHNETVELAPWGWSPAEVYYLSAYNQIKEQKVYTKKTVNSDLFERKHAIRFLTQLTEEHPNSLFPEKHQQPQILHSVEEVESFLLQKQQIVLKSPLSSSGRGLQVIRKNRLNTSNIQWINTNLKQQKYLVGEPLFDKLADLSFQFEIKSKTEVIFHGISQFKTNKNGQYLGHYLNPSPDQPTQYFSARLLTELTTQLLNGLHHSLFSSHYRGFLGIDALIFVDKKQVKIHPCLEINPRCNMGILSKRIEQKIHPESSGQFRIYYNPQQNFLDFAKLETKQNPPATEDRLLRKGFVALTSPSKNSKFGAYIRLF
ncbi:hypothetical protein [uncultured Sunxiuqinia sp.]|uniref:hypothetical protein n=1 Tax=uncultured Sunxiuqinia sp. TaxID=1573825 RepID=UPI002AA65BD2|nr:hypothetical protein [uncultured Sunxiuqinia sp.]